MVHLTGEPVDFQVPESFNLTEYLVDRHVTSGLGDRLAYIQAESGRSVTYAQLHERINRAGNVLLDIGVEMEDRVAIILPDSIEYVEVLLGAIRVGAQPVLLSTLESKQFYEFVLGDCRAKALVVHANLLEKVRDATDRLGRLRKVIAVGGSGIGKALSYEELIKNASGNLQPERLHKDDFCYWQYSSGTTGPPKGVIHYQHDPLYSCESYYRHVLKESRNDVNFSTSKIFFAYGLGNSVWAPLYFGASTVLMSGPPDPEFVLKSIERFRVTLFFSVPVFYSRALAHVDSRGATSFNLDSVRYCVSAGEALPAPIYHKWKQTFGKDILDGIGTTEMCHIFVSNRPDKIRPGTSGVVVPGYEVKLVDEQMKEVNYGEPGRMLVKGGSVAAMYWRRYEKTREHFLGEWFYTGDLYVADEEGYFVHMGRADDLIKSGGVWVSPVEVESAILSHHAVVECAVVQAYTPDGLGRPKAHVVLKAGYSASDELAEEIKRHVMMRLGVGYKVPAWVIFTSDLPKTPTGKIQRFKLREQPPHAVSA
ncbi:MAG: benzoate-CoA ligase family protein [Thaumarchaeota archaeon]|nr:benzoate-CoA ligase family protein [Candidatus Calditenuaceae archaeon]MDW8186684.1 benzoate-CoA ligase family protein [Nitrososphaerota archaeon]